MRFSVLKGKPVYPSKPVCPQCGKGAVMEPHSMAILSGGAMRVTDAATKSAEIAADCIGFLDLTWHSGHGETEGGADARVSLADETPNGQFEFYFCSTGCLRAFLNASVNALEAKIAKTRARRGQGRPPKATPAVPATAKPRASGRAPAKSRR